ncbi:uncharacterized protein LOC143286386 [Babylonia areolata]|uniref:uncharacterized protein LOC143286386 n=1 Tax=Babylonia areolata TaxID=304850 RepID=UPI003FD482EA
MSQAANMKLLAVLLLCSVSVVRGNRLNTEHEEPCTNGAEMMQLYAQHRCEGANPHDVTSHLFNTVMSSLTVSSLQNMLTTYCSTVFPALRQCFTDNVQDCPPEQRQYLINLANRTGFVCQPGTSNVHPYIQSLLSQLSDADLSYNPECDRTDLNGMMQHCYSNAWVTANMSQHFMAPIQERVPASRKYFSSLFECLVGMVREDPHRCPQWRGMALLSLRYVALPTSLGVNMTFTRDQLLAMFQDSDEHAA